ncbi:MAG: RHS repeat-associated core domain-containing protein [Acidobacteriota bacterium]|nr:MAG: RHS repeat-associated core domain-containing protein [Acidobacteriota bacterium]
MALAISSLGQVTGSSSQVNKDTENKADQNLKSIARVNPSTLAMEFSLPLMTYPGRGGNSLPVGMSYSSKVWRMDTRMQWWYWQLSTPRYVNDLSPLFGERTAAGWTSQLQPPRIDMDVKVYDQFGQLFNPNIIDDVGLNEAWAESGSGFANNLMAPCGTRCSHYNVYQGTTTGGETFYVWYCVSHVTDWCDIPTGGPEPTYPSEPPAIPLYYIKRLYVAMADGSTHEFRQDDAKHQCGNSQTGCVMDLTGTFLSTDGSGMRLVRDANGSTLILPDGSKYGFPNTQTAGQGIYANEFTDINGNKLSFSNSTNNGITERKWTDTMGREILDPVPYNEFAQTQVSGKEEVELPGKNGSSLDYELTWSHLRPLGCETDSDPQCGGGESALDERYQDASQQYPNLHFAAKYFCEGNVSTDLSSQYNGEVLFNLHDSGNRVCNDFTVDRDEQGEPLPNAQPYPVRFNPIVLNRLDLPNGKFYEFKYNLYGEISTIVYPSGSYEEFDYGYVESVGQPVGTAYSQSNRGVTERRVYDETGALQSRTKYEIAFSYSAGGNSTYEVTTTSSRADDPNSWGAVSIRSLIAPVDDEAFGFNNPLAGMEKETRSYDESGNIRSRTFNEWITKGPGTGGETNAKRDARIKSTARISFEPDQIPQQWALATLSRTTYDENGSSNPEFFSHLNPKKNESYEYVAQSASSVDEESLGWGTINGWFSSADKASVSETDYLYDSLYLAAGLTGLPTASRVLDPNNESVVLAKTETIYDNILPASNSNAFSGEEDWGEGSTLDCGGGVICWEENTNSRKGRPSTTRLWDDDNDTWIESHVQYDQFGNSVRTKDHLGRVSESIFNSVYKFAYPVKSIAPAPGNGTTGTNQKFEAEATYDLTTGLKLATKDRRDLTTESDDLTTLYEYNDTLLRLTAVQAPNGARAETVYSDTIGELWVKTRAQFDTNTWKESIAYFDSFGRNVKTRTLDSKGDVITESKFDFHGRTTDSSNPYRVDSGGSPLETVLWTRTDYDAAGRVATVYSPVADPDTTPGESAGTRTYGIVNTAGIVGTSTVATDASGRKSRSVTNSLGQLIRVDEPTSFGGSIEADLGTVGSPHQATSYKYNVKGELVEVTQGVQKRYFLYDSLGRLIRVRQPEQEVNSNLNKTDPVTGNSQWTAGFQYDVMGNLVSSTDANDITITYTYDNADRILKRTYENNAAPEVNYSYDLINGSIAYSKGALIETSNSVSSSKFSQFDQWGRPTEYQQITDGTTYATKYTYNLSGALIEEEYPSGRKVKHDFDTDGNVSRVYGQPDASSIDRTWASGFGYAPDGRIERLRLGNGLWEKASFNERLQVTEMGVGLGVENLNRWKINYDYKESLAAGGDANTGTPVSQSIAFEGQANPFVQTYKYDSLYRITEAKELVTGEPPNWIQTFGYDRYGNRTNFSQNLNGTQLALNNVTHPSVNAATNRFSSGQGYQYDQAGNIVTDVTSGGSRDITFNGDNKQTVVKVAGTSTKIGEYFYDGDGRRIKKKAYSGGSLAEEVTFVYSGSKLVAEYSTLGAPQNPKSKYTSTDALGSVRLLTDENGSVVSRRDFMPFGEELPDDVNYRKNTLGYVGDDVRQHFTGYLKDDETGLDFAEARMYNSQHGRFTAVDPLLASGKSALPQTFNRYGYVRNNPIDRTDPNGLCEPRPCPTEYEGDVYYKRTQSGYWYSNVPENDGGDWHQLMPWDAANNQFGINRDQGNLPTFYTSSGWTEAIDGGESSVPYVTDTQQMLRAFRTNPFYDAGRGLLKGFGNAAISTYNFGAFVTTGNFNIESVNFSKLSISGTYSNPNAFEKFGCSGQIECNYSTAGEVGLPIALGGVGGLLSKSGSLTSLGIASTARTASNAKYVGYFGYAADGSEAYVGITSRNPLIRFGEHLNAEGTGRELLIYREVKGARFGSKLDARVWEQTQINRFGLSKNGGPLLNKINSISQKRWDELGVQ